MALPTRSSRKAIIALSSIAITHFYGALAFQIAPATRTRLYHHDGSHHQQRTVLMANGNDDWCIDDADHSGSINPDWSKLENDKTKDDDNADDNDTRTYFATCIPGLHETLASELIGLGASHVETQGKSGVRFQGTPEVGMKSILWCRTAHKIMELLASSCDSPPTPSADNDGDGDFDYQNDNDFTKGIRNREDLYQFTKSACHIQSLLGDGSGGLLTLSVSTIYASKAPNKDLCHGHFTALTVKNALVDAVRDIRPDGDRPNVDTENSDVPLVVVIRGRQTNDGRGGRESWRDNGRGGRRGNNDNYNQGYGHEEQTESVAEVDLYRCLHSGGSLHRRGYRQGDLDPSWEDDTEAEQDKEEKEWGAPSSKAPIHRAAMKESLAAGLLLEAGWDKLVLAARGDGKGAVLVDPMTGSGTLPTEAALIACDMAPGLLRITNWRGIGGRGNPHRYPPCMRWKDFGNLEAWDEILAEASARAKSGMKWALSSSESVPKNLKILCNEKNPRAASLAQTSIRNAGMKAIVSLSEGDCNDWNLGGGDPANTTRDVLEGRTVFVCNPPWGLRLTEDIDESWVSLREFFRREAGGCESWVLSGNRDLTKILRMKKSRTVVLKTADEDLRWLQYHIFQKREVPAESQVQSPAQ